MVRVLGLLSGLIISKTACTSKRSLTISDKMITSNVSSSSNSWASALIKLCWGYFSVACLITYSEGRAEVELAPWNPYAMDYTFTVPYHAVVTTFKVRPNLEINYKKSTGNIKER